MHIDLFTHHLKWNQPVYAYPSTLETRTPRNEGQFVVHEELTSNERDKYIYNPNAKEGQKMISQ